MEIIQVIGIGLIGLIIVILLKQYKPEFALYASLITGVLIVFLITNKITIIIDLLNTLSNKASINNKFIMILLKITGISLLTEFAVTVCKDTGESAIANKIDLGGKVIIIAMSLPIISSLLELILKILP